MSPERSQNKTNQEPPDGYEEVQLDQNTNCPSLEGTKRKKECWLIKVPENFDASCLTGQTVVLNGVQDIPNYNSKENNERYEVLSKPINSSLPSSFKALLPSSSEKASWSAKAFKGSMSVVKSVSIPTPDTDVQPEFRRNVEAPDIKCRWQPFGYKQPINSHPVDLKEDDTKSKDDTSKAHKRKTKKHNRHEECTESNEILSVKVKVEKASPQKVKIKEEKMSPPVQVKEELETPKKKRKKSK